MKDSHKVKRDKRLLRHARVRSVVSGTAARPRLSVFRSGAHIYAQLIDDQAGRTLAAASSLMLKARGKSVKGSEQAKVNQQAKAKKSDQSSEVGKMIAEKARALNIESIVFDRAGYKYHGRVKALAEGARAGGLKF